MKVIVRYNDTKGKTRWGYVTRHDMQIFDEYLRNRKRQAEEKDNEVLDANIRQMSNTVIRVFLPDGTVGDAKLSDLLIVEPFVEYAPLKAE